MVCSILKSYNFSSVVSAFFWKSVHFFCTNLYLFEFSVLVFIITNTDALIFGHIHGFHRFSTNDYCFSLPNCTCSLHKYLWKSVLILNTVPYHSVNHVNWKMIIICLWRVLNPNLLHNHICLFCLYLVFLIAIVVL